MPAPRPADATANGTAPSPRRAGAWGIAALESSGAVAVGLLILLVSIGFDLEEFADQPPPGVVAIHLADLAIGLLLGLAIGPLRFLSDTRAGTVIHVMATALGAFSVAALPAVLVALYRLGRQRRWSLDLLALGLLSAGSLVFAVLDSEARGTSPSLTWGMAVALGVAIGLAALLLGRLSGTRRALVASLQEQADAADRERAAAEKARDAADQARMSAENARASAEATARAEERTAIARDMHDSISHHLATIAMHAGAMSYRKDLPPQELRRIASTVRDAAQLANGELREVLVALRSKDGTQPLASAPTLTDQVESARARDHDVQLTWQDVTEQELDRRGRSTVVALSRILGEVIANAAKHAPGRPLRVTLARREDRLVLTAVNELREDTSGLGSGDGGNDGARPVAPLSTGHGLIGIQERARLLGGDAHVDHTGERFEVEAWMPW